MTSFEESLRSVPEQGGGKLIPEGMGKPGSVLYRIQIKDWYDLAVICWKL